MSLETPLARVRGLGAAGHGGEHWSAMRMNSLALLFLTVWLAVSLLRLPALDHRTLAEWLASPFAAAPMLLFVAVLFRHAEKGLKEVIDDYVHDEGLRAFALVLLAFAAWGAAALAAFAVLKVALAAGGAGPG